MAPKTPRVRRRWLVLAIRWGLPLAITIAGVVFIVLGHGHVSNVTDAPSGSVFSAYPTDKRSIYTAIGVGLLLIALMVWMVGWFARMNSRDGADRARDEAARDYYSRTGRWPGERGPSGTNR